MKKITFDTVFKTSIMISLVYSLCLLTIIVNNSGVGRYQKDYSNILDTKTGKLYIIDGNDNIYFNKDNKRYIFKDGIIDGKFEESK